jgi:tetratricopeptide (TPR) repeat protein
MPKKSRARAAAVSRPAADGIAPLPGPNTFLARRSVLLAGAVVVLATWVAYHNSFHGPFIADDYDGIVGNASIKNWKSALFPPTDTTTAGRPLFSLTLALNYALGGMNVWGYHVFNLLVHTLAGLTLFGIVRRTLLRPAMAGRRSQISDLRSGMSEPTWLALAVAVIWAVHPLLTQAVTFISERAESLMALFYLLTLYCFIRGVEARGQEARGQISENSDRRTEGKRRIASNFWSLPSALWLLFSVFFCLLGVMTKEVIVTAPVMIFLYDRTFVAGSFGQAWRRHWRYFLGLAGIWVLQAFIMRIKGQGAGFNQGVTSWHYALTSCRSVVLYLKLAIWPHPLVFDYGSKSIIVQHGAEILPQALVLVALLTGTAIALWRWPAVGFAGAWFFVVLAPASSIVPVVFQPTAEYRAYLPSVAIVALVVLGLHALIGRRSLIIFAAVAVGLGWLTVLRNNDYRSERSILSDTVAKCPGNARAHNNLGLVLTHIPGCETEAVAQCEAAVKLEPCTAGYHSELGSALANVPGRERDAIAEYRTALRIKPDSADTHNNLAMSLQDAGDFPAALAEYKEALKLAPTSAWIHTNLGALYSGMPGRLADAISEFEAALKVDPDMFMARCNLANSLAREGQFAAARAEYDEALKRHPDYADGHIGLGVMLVQLGRLDDAIAQFESALQLQPGNASAQEDLALAQSMKQKGLPPNAPNFK